MHKNDLSLCVNDLKKLGVTISIDDFGTEYSSLSRLKTLPIDRIKIDDQTHYYTIEVKLFNDMTNLGHVYILKSKNRDEIINLEKKEEKDE